MLKIVLLPEPFGPIRPRISPLSSLNEMLLTAVKPPKRLTSPATSSTRALLRRVRRAGRQFQHRFALLLRLRPDDMALIVDVLHDYRVGALVLSRHRFPRRLELDSEAEHCRSVRQIGVDRRLA